MSRPSTPALFSLFLRTALRRFGNRYLLGMQKAREARQARKNGKAARGATSHRQQGKLEAALKAGALASLILGFISFQVLTAFGNSAALARVELDQRGEIVSVTNYSWLERHDRNWKDRRSSPPPESFPNLENDWRAAQAENRERLAAHYAAHGLAGFRPAVETPPWQGEASLMTETARPTWFRAGGLLAGMAALYLFASGLGLLNKNVNSAEPSLLWLFDFPVSRAWLFAGKIAEAAFDNIGAVLTGLVPAALIWQAGGGAWAVFLGGLGFGLLFTLNAAALRVLAEVYLLQKFKRRTRGILSGFVTILSVVLMLTLLYGGQSPQLVKVIVGLAENLPAPLWWSPFTLGLGTDPAALAHPLGPWTLGVAITALFTTGCARAAARLTRGGFEPSGESAPRPVSPAAASPEGATWLSPLIRRELLRLKRQPSALVQMLAAPAIMFLIQYMQAGGHVVERLAGNESALASAIFGFSVYLVITSGASALTHEIKCVWFVLALPRSLADTFRAGARLAGAVAIGLALVLTALSLAAWPSLAPGLLLRLPFILLYLWMLAELLRGIQLLGLSILSDTRVALTARSNYLTLLVSASAGQAVYQGNLWTLTVMAVLIGMLNFSVWQKVRAELPYLTEPMENPPPRLHLMHGMMAVFFFFVGQTVAGVIATAAGASPGFALVLGYIAGGVVVGLLTVWLLRRAKVRWWPEATGSLAQTFSGLGLGWLLTSLMGWVWLMVLKTQDTLPTLGEVSRAGLFLLAVIAAPIVEEIIFRGLVYQGLRQSLKPLQAVLLSSLLFTIVHPGASAPCVFLLAVVNAALLERTGRLWACMLVHAGYNAVVLSLQ